MQQPALPHVPIQQLRPEKASGKPVIPVLMFMPYAQLQSLNI
jgi:hypothetical protein